MDLDLDLKFRFCHIFAILQLFRDQPVVSGVGNRGIRLKPTTNLKSLATFSHAQGRIIEQTESKSRYPRIYKDQLNVGFGQEVRQYKCMKLDLD